VLVIRRSQMKVFEKASAADFARRLRGHLQEKFPNISDDVLSGRIAAGLESAASFEIKRECDVVRYVELFCKWGCAATGQAFPKPALNILYSYGVEAAQKLDRLEAWLAANPNSNIR
jgi:hypothetical protein